jgi:hypothetical protein
LTKSERESKLRELYSDQGLNAMQIGGILSLTRERVRQLLNEYNITNRPCCFCRNPVQDRKKLACDDCEAKGSIGHKHGPCPVCGEKHTKGFRRCVKCWKKENQSAALERWRPALLLILRPQGATTFELMLVMNKTNPSSIETLQRLLSHSHPGQLLITKEQSGKRNKWVNRYYWKGEMPITLE